MDIDERWLCTNVTQNVPTPFPQLPVTLEARIASNPTRLLKRTKLPNTWPEVSMRRPSRRKSSTAKVQCLRGPIGLTRMKSTPWPPMSSRRLAPGGRLDGFPWAWNAPVGRLCYKVMGLVSSVNQGMRKYRKYRLATFFGWVRQFTQSACLRVSPFWSERIFKERRVGVVKGRALPSSPLCLAFEQHCPKPCRCCYGDCSG